MPERDEDDRRRPDHPVDLLLEGRGRVAERPRLAGDLLGVALLAHGVDLVVAGAAEARTSRRARGRAPACGSRRTRRSASTRPWSGRATAITSPSATSWSPGSMRTTSPGTTSSARRPTGAPSRIDLRAGARRAARAASRVSFAFSSWRMPMYELSAAMNPKIASAQRPSERIRMKKTPMIALNSVSVFAATMEATERLFGGSGSPSWSRRRAASALDESPRVCRLHDRSH